MMIKSNEIEQLEDTEEMDEIYEKEFKNQYNDLISEIKNYREDVEKEKFRAPKVKDASYFNMSPFRIVNNVPFKARDLQW